MLVGTIFVIEGSRALNLIEGMNGRGICPLNLLSISIVVVGSWFIVVFLFL